MSAILESRGVSRQWRKSKRDKGGGKTKSREVQELPDGLSEASWFSSSGRVIPGWDPAVDPTLKGNGVFDPDAHYESNTTSPAGPLSAADTTSGSSAGSATSEDGDLPRAMIAADGSASDAGAVHFSADDAVASARLQQWVTQGSQEEETRNTVTCSPPTANKTWAKVTNPSPAPLRVDALERDAEIKALQVSVDVEIKSEMTICEQQSGDAHPHFSVLESLQRALHAERDARDTAVSAGIAVARAESFDELREMANGVATEAATRVFLEMQQSIKSAAGEQSGDTLEELHQSHTAALRAAVEVAEQALAASTESNAETRRLASQLKISDDALAVANETSAKLESRVAELERSLKDLLPFTKSVTGMPLREKKIKTVSFIKEEGDDATDEVDKVAEKEQVLQVKKKSATIKAAEAVPVKNTKAKKTKANDVPEKTVTEVTEGRDTPIEATEHDDTKSESNRHKWVTAKRTARTAATVTATSAKNAQGKVKRKHSVDDQYDGPECVFEPSPRSEASYFSTFEDVTNDVSDNDSEVDEEGGETKLEQQKKQASRKRLERKKKNKKKAAASADTTPELGSVEQAQREVLEEVVRLEKLKRVEEVSGKTRATAETKGDSKPKTFPRQRLIRVQASPDLRWGLDAL